MRALRTLSRLFRRRRMDAELEEEIRCHLRMAQRDRVDRGESESDAGVNARREFGNVLRVKETARDIWGWTAMENFARDLRHALRQLKKHPGFTAVAVGTLALGLGSTTAMFSVVKGVLLEPLQYRDPSRLFLAYARFPLLSFQKGPVNARHFHEWRARCRACESVALVDGVAYGVAGRGESKLGEPRRVPGLRVSANLFRTLGVVPALGRDFLPEEELPGRSDVALISDTLWRDLFARDPSAVGQTLNLDGVAGSDVVIYQAGTATIIESSQNIAGTSYQYVYSAGQAGTSIDIGLFKEGLTPFYIRSYQLGSANATVPAAQQVDRFYL